MKVTREESRSAVEMYRPPEQEGRMVTAMVRRPAEDAGALIENVVIRGDLKDLTAAQRAAYYRDVCQSIGLNPLSRPFDYLTLNGKMVLYARKDATDQLRRIYGVSIVSLDREIVGETYVVTALARMPDGRVDSDVGATSIAGLRGDNLVNAMLKAITKAKRRVTLSICGLGWLDETEVETIPSAYAVEGDPVTGEVTGPPATTPKLASGKGRAAAIAKIRTLEDELRGLNVEIVDVDPDHLPNDAIVERGKALAQLKLELEAAGWPAICERAVAAGAEPIPEDIGSRALLEYVSGWRDILGKAGEAEVPELSPEELPF